MDDTIRMEEFITLLRAQLFESFYNWLERNKTAISEKWYANLFNEAKKGEDISDNAVAIMWTALWMFNMVSDCGILAGIGPNSVSIQEIDRRLDEKSTMRLLHLISAAMALQHLPKEIATQNIPIISGKRFSLKLWSQQRS
jgi:hypothetical protein